MKLRVFGVKKMTLRIALPVFIFLSVVFSLYLHFGLLNARAESERSGGRLITLHDRGQTVSFMTSEATIESALQSAGIELDARDAVEPSRTEKLVAADYQVNIYRVRPVTVIDGSVRQKVFTPYQSADKVVKDAGISLNPEDLAEIKRSSNVLGGSGLEIEITRAVEFNFDLYGSHSSARTQAKTVGDMLADKGIKLGDSGRVSPGAKTPISEGLNIRVWREGVSTISVDEDVKFEIEQIKDTDQPVGYKKINTPGSNGSKTVTYEIEIKDGQEVRRTEIASVVKVEAVKQVEVVGSKPEYMKYTGGGNKDTWLAASNIPRDMWGYAEWLVAKESGWNPNAKNKYSGACGLAQALPCSKVPGNAYNPINSLNWMNGYVNGRYGGWEGAVNHSKAKGWY